MKREDYTAVKKVALAAIVASYMCIATACAGSDNAENMYNNDTWSTNDDYVNSVTNGTDRYNNTGIMDNTNTSTDTYDAEDSDRLYNDRNENRAGTTNGTGNGIDPGITNQNQSGSYNNDSLMEDAGDAADRTLNNVGDAANDLLDGAGNIINNATDAGASRP